MLPLEILAQAASESSEKLDQETLQRFMNKGAIVVIFLAIVLIIFICFVVSWGRNVKRLVRRNRSGPSDQLEEEWYKKPLVSSKDSESEFSGENTSDEDSSSD